MSGYRWFNLVFGLLLAGSLLALPWLQSSGALPVCVWRSHTGRDCPACGLTRSTAAACRGDWPESRRWHPAGVWVLAYGVWQILARFVVWRCRQKWIPYADLAQIIVLWLALTALTLRAS